jgi:SAM-dependent methyltransferase
MADSPANPQLVIYDVAMHKQNEQLGNDRSTVETVDFVRRFAGERRRLLDVGCGDGTIARVLMNHGFDVTGIDGNAEAVAEAKTAGVNALHYELLDFPPGTTYDVVLFSKSLHHMHPLDESLQAADTLLSACGVLIVDEFGAELVDLKTALWFYGVKSLIEIDGAQEHEKHRHHQHQCGNHRGHGPKLDEGSIPADPVQTWREHHFGKHEVIDSQSLLASLQKRFSIQYEERLPYLYRYFVGALPVEQGDKLYDWETRLCEYGLIERVGLRVVAEKRS